MSNKKRHGVMWWLFIGWWAYPSLGCCYLIKGIYFDIPVFIICTIVKFVKAAKMEKASPQKPPSDPNTTPINPNAKTYHATGMRYRIGNLLSLGIENPDYSKSAKELIDDYTIEERVWEYAFYPKKVELIPEPDNPHDPNAIKVIVDGAHIAYIKKGSCAHLLKVMQQNRIEDIRCIIGGGNYKYIYPDDDGKWEDDCGELYSMVSDSTEYYVWLYITEKE